VAAAGGSIRNLQQQERTVMETLLTWLAVSLAGLLVSAHVTVRLPLLGVVPVLGVVALALVLALVLALAWVARSILLDGGIRLRPRMVAL
jgi:FtsH-binding integral membrane protein